MITSAVPRTVRVQMKVSGGWRDGVCVCCGEGVAMVLL